MTRCFKSSCWKWCCVFSQTFTHCSVAIWRHCCFPLFLNPYLCTTRFCLTFSFYWSKCTTEPLQLVCLLFISSEESKWETAVLGHEVSGFCSLQELLFCTKYSLVLHLHIQTKTIWSDEIRVRTPQQSLLKPSRAYMKDVLVTCMV